MLISVTTAANTVGSLKRGSLTLAIFAATAHVLPLNPNHISVRSSRLCATIARTSHNKKCHPLTAIRSNDVPQKHTRISLNKLSPHAGLDATEAHGQRAAEPLRRLSHHQRITQHIVCARNVYFGEVLLRRVRSPSDTRQSCPIIERCAQINIINIIIIISSRVSHHHMCGVFRRRPPRHCIFCCGSGCCVSNCPNLLLYMTPSATLYIEDCGGEC